jgi:serine protease Do
MAPALGYGSELRLTPIVKVVQRVGPSVVSIRGEKTVVSTGSQSVTTDAPRRVNGMGTGVVIDPRGYVLTNYHVVDGVREIEVTMVDKKRYVATLVARDLETDLAIIKINPSAATSVIQIGTSSDLMPGEPVIAVGNAFGYEHTVTRGIISALHRAVQISDAQYYDDLIQTDASINPGNSGGPLLNIDGDMIGINVAVRAGAQGIGFAIPVDRAMAIAANLLATSGVKVWHGMAAASDAPASLSGMKVASVEAKSPAADAGLQPGDVVTAVDGTEVHRTLDFHRAMLEHKPGDKVDVTIERDGKELAMSIELADIPESARPAPGPAWDLLGLELKPMTPAEFRQKFQTRYRGGLTVVDVRQNSPAFEQGIRAGDVLVGMHIWETVSLDNVSYILKRPDFNSMTPLKFFILRGNETLYGYMPVALKVARQ